MKKFKVTVTETLTKDFLSMQRTGKMQQTKLQQSITKLQRTNIS